MTKRHSKRTHPCHHRSRRAKKGPRDGWNGFDAEVVTLQDDTDEDKPERKRNKNKENGKGGDENERRRPSFAGCSSHDRRHGKRVGCRGRDRDDGPCGRHRRRLARIDVGLTAFVDAVFGNDATGAVQRQDRPFRTVQEAVDAVVAFRHRIRPPSDPKEMAVVVRPGTYPGDVTIPASLTLLGTSAASTVLKGTAKVIAASPVVVGIESLGIDAVDAEAVLVDADGASVVLADTVLKSAWTTAAGGGGGATVVRAATARVLKGALRVTDSDLAASVDASNPRATVAALISVEGVSSSARVSAATAELDVVADSLPPGTAPLARIAQFDVIGGRAIVETSDTVLKVSGSRAAGSIAVASADASTSPASVLLRGAAVRIAAPSLDRTVSLERGVGSAELDMDQLSADLTAVPAAARFLAQGVAAATGAPLLSALAVFFPFVVPAPPVTGSFASARFLALEGDGAMSTTGGVRAGAAMTAPAAVIAGPLTYLTPVVALSRAPAPAQGPCSNPTDFPSGTLVRLDTGAFGADIHYCLPAPPSLGYRLCFFRTDGDAARSITFAMRDGSAMRWAGRVQAAGTGANADFDTGIVREVAGLLSVKDASLKIVCAHVGTSDADPTEWDILGITTVA